MIQVYNNTQQTLVLDISGNSNPVIEADAAPTVEYFDVAGNSVGTGTTIEGLPGEYNVIFPLWLTQEDGLFRVEWSYSVDSRMYTKVDFVDVVTPYVTLNELRDYDSRLAGLDDPTLINLERHARLMIDTVTGQSFGKSEGTIFVYGSDAWNLTLPVRVISLTSVTYQYNNYIVAEDDLLQPGNLLDTVVTKLDDYTLGFIGYGYPGTWNWQSTGVITAPPVAGMPFFRSNQVFALTGEFGWETVPEDIAMAAKMLVRDYSDKDDIYRRKGITQVQSGTLQLQMGANSSTGNVDVDRILGAYYSTGMAVI